MVDLGGSALAALGRGPRCQTGFVRCGAAGFGRLCVGDLRAAGRRDDADPRTALLAGPAVGLDFPADAGLAEHDGLVAVVARAALDPEKSRGRDDGPELDAARVAGSGGGDDAGDGDLWRNRLRYPANDAVPERRGRGPAECRDALERVEDDVDAEESDDDEESEADEESDDNSEDTPNVLIGDPQYLVWRQLPDHRQQEFIQRREWSVLTGNYLPLRRVNNQRRNEGIHGNDAVADADEVDDTDDGAYSVSTVSFHPDDESVDSFDSLFREADFPRILADLEVIRQNGRIRLEDGTYQEIDEPEEWRFTERDIRNNIRHYPDSFLHRYFEEPWPNFH